MLAAAAVFVAATPSLPPLPDEDGDDADHASPEAAAWLPASRTVFPESVLSDSMLAGLASPESAWQVDAASGSDADLPMEEARELMLSAVRSHAPVAGSLTLMKIRRARSRYELERLLEEVESRIEKSRKREPSDQTVRRVRDLLGHSRPA